MYEKSKKYAIAVKREMRSCAPADWMDQLLTIEDLLIVGKASAAGTMVKATPEAIERAKALLGKYCHIEPLIVHKPS